MSFLYPDFLWALLFVAVPIIIHLFYFRRFKKMYFSNVDFLNEVKDERSSKNKLKHLLVLLSRILMIIFLVIAFAQPFFKSNQSNSKEGQTISIYLDNSFSMKAEGNGQLLFDEGKQVVKNIIETFAENDLADANKYQILSNDFEGKHQRFVNKTEALSLLKELNISAAIRNSKDVFERQRMNFKSKSVDNTVFQVSDFQKNNLLLVNDSSISISIVKLSSAEQRNIFVDSVWLENSFQLKGANNKMIVRFKNESNEYFKGNYQLILNDNVKSVGEYSIDKNSISYDTVFFKIDKTGWNTGRIQISDYPITYDDKFYFSFFVEEKVNVLSIYESNNNHIFQSVFKEINNVNFKSVNLKKLDYNNLNQQDFIILNGLKAIPSGLSQQLEKYVENGGSLLLIPHKNTSLPSYNVLLSSLNIGVLKNVNLVERKVKNTNLKHYILNDLFEETPRNLQKIEVSKYYSLQTKVNNIEEKIFSFSNNETYLSSFSVKSGQAYVLSSPLEKQFSNFTTSALFAPVVYKMAILSVSNTNLFFEINANTQIQLKKIPENFEDIIKMKIDNFETIPQKNYFGGLLTLNLINSNTKAGIYRVFNDKQTYQAKVALNYNRKESELSCYSLGSLKNKLNDKNISVISSSISSIKENISTNKQGKMLWKWFIVISLLFLAFEILLLKLLKE